MIHDKSVNYFASLSIYGWSNQGQYVRAKQSQVPALDYTQTSREARGIHLEKLARLEASALEQQPQSHD